VKGFHSLHGPCGRRHCLALHTQRSAWFNRPGSGESVMVCLAPYGSLSVCFSGVSSAFSREKRT
jgi:hypothetical protein